MKLRNKIHLYSSVMFAALLILMNSTVYWLFSEMTTENLLKQADAEASAVTEGLRNLAGTLPESDLLRAYMPVDGMLRLVAQEDRRSLATVTSPTEQELYRLPSIYYEARYITSISFADKRYALASIPVIWHDGSILNVQVYKSMDSVVERLDVLRLVLLLVTVAALVPVFLSGRLLGSLIMRPITEMTTTMREIRRSGAFKKLEQKRKSKDELHTMGETFNGMIELLESNYERQKQFVSNASHELKTPLTVIESYSSLLLRRGKERPELYEESLEAIHSEAVRLKEMTEQLLLLARNKEQWDLQFAETDLCELAEQSAQAFRRAYNREIDIVTPAAPVMAYTDEGKLKQLLYIFLDNARKYSETGITVTVETKGGECRVTVQDRGIGIPKKDLDKVFDRFYRVDSARSRGQGGSGLGLSLAREIAEALGARIELDSLEGAGTTVRITLSPVSHLDQLQ